MKKEITETASEGKPFDTRLSFCDHIKWIYIKTKFYLGRKKIGIVAIAKNEGKYIREWVSFHKAVGFDVIYLFNHDSTDNTIEVIQDFIDDGFVKVRNIHGKRRQLDAYNLGMILTLYECAYVAVIDCDEFLYPCREEDDLRDIVFQEMSAPGHGGFVVNWQIYGSSGLKEQTDGLVIERFLYRSNIKTLPPNKHIKTIVNPRTVASWPVSHFPLYIPGYCSYNEDGKPVVGPFNEIDENGPRKLRINHYFTKSLAEYKERRVLKGVDDWGIRGIEDFYTHDHNEFFDDSALRYLEKTKEYMESTQSDRRTPMRLLNKICVSVRKHG